jgi:hypothetical protein
MWFPELRCRRGTNKQALNKWINARVHSSLGSYNCQGRSLVGNGLAPFFMVLVQVGLSGPVKNRAAFGFEDLRTQPFILAARQVVDHQ